MKKLAVTGGSGFIGSHLIETLRKDYKVINLDIKEGYDLLKICNLADELEGVDTVFDLATLPLPLSLRFPYWVADDIYKMCLNLCELCRQDVFKTLIHISSSEAYGSAAYTPMDETHPLLVRTPYASAKASADLTIQAYRNTFGIDCAIARPFNNYGPRQPIRLGGIIPATIDRIMKGERPIIYGNGTQQRTFIYVKDTVRGIIEIWKNKQTRGKVINLATDKTVSINEVVAKISSLLDYHGKPVYKKTRTADVRKHHASTMLAKDMLDFKSRYTFEQGLKETIKWYSSHTS